MPRPLIFVGSRQCMMALANIAELNGIEILGILDHHYWGNTDSIGNIPVIGDERWLLDVNNTQAQTWLTGCDFFAANYWNGQQSKNPNLQKLRQDRIKILEQSRASIINLIHPSVNIYKLNSKYHNVRLGKGIEIHDDCWISLDHTTIGDYCSIQNNSRIGHDAVLGNNVIISPDAWMFNCEIGNDVFIGMSSMIDIIEVSRREKSLISIGNNSSVWANARITRDIPDNSIYTNNNRILKKLNDRN
jgi:carbonic anhydrase/acetyltransferase-like protein (isoleucine patch superfamily)